MAVTQFGAPIPGQSLTTSKPGERRWERPPEAASVEDALRFYMERLSDEEVIDDFMVAIEAGVAIVPLVETLYLSNVMNGIHSLDVGMLSDMASYLEGEKPQEEIQEEPPEPEELQQVAEPMEEPMEEITAEPMPPEGAGLMARGV